jgi:hypothetical protein
MNTPDCLALDFGLQHFGKADLGDKRRTDRLVKSANRIVQRPDQSLPHKLHTPADLDAFYRLMNRPETTHAAVIDPHREVTREKMLLHSGPVLIIHDATELDYTTITSLIDLGQIGNGRRRGYICQNSLAVAVTPDTAEVLGLANQILHTRCKTPRGETKAQSRQRQDRESRLWVDGAQAVGATPEGACWVHVADRGSDTFEALENFNNLGLFLVRANTSRKIARGHDPDSPTDAKLLDYARSLPSSGTQSVKVQYRPADRKGKKRRPAQPQRQATVRIAAAPVQIQAPHVHRGEHGDEPLALWIVHLLEENPPSKADPLEWFLLTNRPVHTLADALEVVRWYELRWIIEELHKAMKTGCRVQNLQFTTEEALKPAIALLSVVATFLLNLRELARRPDADTRPACEVACPQMVKVLCLSRYKEDRPNWSLKAFMLALGRLGGHQNRKSDGMPGWLTLWRGWQALHPLVQGYRLHSNRLQCGVT